MRATGYPITWPTKCFIGGGCGESVFAHTNGDGDFVLFDSLGWPWPIHDCYARRFGDDDRIPGLAPTVYREYRNTQVVPPSNRPRPQDIMRIAPTPGGRMVEILGRLQDYVENAVAKRLKTMGDIGRQQILKRLGTRRSQITVVTDELKSFTAFVDLGQLVVSKGAMVAARLRPTAVVPGEATFVVEDLKVYRTPKA